jgi:hypothetical protein
VSEKWERRQCNGTELEVSNVAGGLAEEAQPVIEHLRIQRSLAVTWPHRRAHQPRSVLLEPAGCLPHRAEDAVQPLPGCLRIVSALQEAVSLDTRVRSARFLAVIGVDIHFVSAIDQARDLVQDERLGQLRKDFNKASNTHKCGSASIASS